MGWDFRTQPCNKQEIIEECLKSVALECIAHSLKGNELWVVWQRKDNSRYISVFLLSSNKKLWGYKEISEIEHPYYYKCPLSFLKLVPIANHSWRESVISYHEKKSKTKKIAVGNIVALDVDSNEFRVTRLKPFQGISLKDNRKYLLIKRRIVNVRDSE